ncbi:glyoxylase I 4-like [Henckelia pumila]|uniref:glyoxylase I 4-like n=1 Tax=Henckelia pumila TaxID=405737 RepID=UPI003C6E9A20
MGREINIVNVEEAEKEEELFIKASSARELPLLALNHVSFVCKSVKKSVQFYEQVLGFVLIKRPSSFDFEGAWLFNHGIGIHLLEMESAPSKKGKINPKDNHISFQCTNMELIIQQLEEMKVEYVKGVVREGGILVDQIFFHDPDGYMVEICNCQNIPILPISSSSCPIKNKMIIPNPNTTLGSVCRDEVEAEMMENLALDMMEFSI